ncbi:hypothetical protein ABIA35_008591 [Catenulispora sp. MAP12-49]|uniref:hypothetical protein n=1 Tax=Catenulispora sp. MAP12-49 TaxID=3156302 RepID=UPI0035174158
MARFIVLYRAPQEVAERFATATPEEAQAGMLLWGEWFGKLGPAVVDPGRPLGNARTVTGSGITAAPTDIIGMTILQADTMDDALAMVRDHHHLQWADSCTITVLEEMPIPEIEAGIVA